MNITILKKKMAVPIKKSILSAQVEGGMKKAALAAYYELPVAQMTKVLKDAGLTIRKFHAPKYELEDDMTEDVVENSLQEVQEDVNIDEEQVSLQDALESVEQEEEVVMEIQNATSNSEAGW